MTSLKLNRAFFFWQALARYLKYMKVGWYACMC
jgi:hypothetical protein